MYNVILTKKDGSQYYVGSNGQLTKVIDELKLIAYTFDDFEDANNVSMDYIIQNWKEDEDLKIEVEQF